MQRKKIGFIAFSARGANLAQDCVRELGDFLEPAAAFDPNTADAEEKMRQRGLSIPIYPTVEEMLANAGQLDWLFISSPEDCHLESLVLDGDY